MMTDARDKITSKLPPGPVWVPYAGIHDVDNSKECEKCRVVHDIPDGYIWQPATEGTGAGWVRPRGGVK